MEVCGRYHHWMPILVKVVHKDLFFSWCLAYVRALEVRAVAQSYAITPLKARQCLSLL
jgi:heme/copper-type cytochrome/quinol oxidase subunit 2